MKLKWDKSLEIGHENIDEQHKELFEKVNYFFDSIESRMEKEETIRILDFLEKYADEHFNDEESLQRNYNYPRYMEHCAQHQAFRNQLSDIRYMLNNYGITGAVTNYFSQKIMVFWQYHVNYLDKSLGEYIKEIDNVQDKSENIYIS